MAEAASSDAGAVPLTADEQELLGRTYDIYAAKMQQLGLLSYDDQLHRCLWLLTSHSEVWGPGPGSKPAQAGVAGKRLHAAAAGRRC